ncbi:MAG: hypothetical protein LBF88_07100 [Planctomycetaceae bacterium]|jgi:hypothetical protein|nr:hypothetical protein [Planctomycetaceae bacterium]
MMLVLLCSVSAISVAISKKNKKIALLDEAKTAAEVEAYVAEKTAELFPDEK